MEKQPNRHWRLLVTTLAIPLGAIVAPNVAAAEDSSLSIEEVVVTARKIEESSQSVPVAITAISTERLTDSTIRDLVDLNGFAPNVNISEDGSRGGGGASITIRGISPTRTDDNSFDSPIGVMIDDIYLGSLAGQVLENFDLERVEVLRGPQGTLFGKNTIGGVVHVIRSRPTGELGARVKATFGNNDQREVRAVFNAPIIDESLAVKAFFTLQNDDGFQDNITTGNDVGDRDYLNYGITLLATPGDRFEALFTAEQFKDDSRLNAFHNNFNLAAGVLPPPANPRDADFSTGLLACTAFFPDICRTSLDRPSDSENDTDNDSSLDTDALTLRMSLDLNDNLSLVSVTGYRNQDETRIYDFDGSAANYITIDRDNDYDQFSQELRISGTYDKLSFTGGLYYFRNEFTQDWATGGTFWSGLFSSIFQGSPNDPAVYGVCSSGAAAPIFCDDAIDAVPVGELVNQILFETQETESYAAFFQGDYRITDRLTVTAGIRWTEEEKTFQAGQAYLTAASLSGNRNFPDFANLNNTWNDVSPKLGVTYNLTDSAILYASYSEGFHSGGFFGVNQNVRDFERDQYSPERAQSYEIGLKSQWIDNRLRLNVTAFRNDFEDKQESSVQVDPDTQTVFTGFSNVADATYQGFEIETQYVFSQNFRAFVNYGYLDADYSDFFTDVNANDGITLIEDASFLSPRNAPKNTIGVGGTFSKQMGPGSLEIYAKYAYTDSIETDLLNAPLARLGSVEDVTASIGYYTDNYRISIFGRNLTDQRNETFTPIANLFAVGTVNRPRTYGLELSYDFNN